MTNQSRIGTDKKYPPRFRTPDSFVSWERQAVLYNPPIFPEFDSIQEKLHEAGLEVPNVKAFYNLATFSTKQAVEIYGPGIARIRHPLGRTGINGTGIFYNAGESKTADLMVTRKHKQDGLQLALVYNRGKWRLPGGFVDDIDDGDRRKTALREAQEEITLDLSNLLGEFITIQESHVKPNSSRSVDMGYITNQVEGIYLPDPEIGDDLMAGDDAEDAEWASPATVDTLFRDGLVSTDHYRYIQYGLTIFNSLEN